MNQQQWTVWSVIGVLFTWGLQVFSYMGIIDQARNKKNTSKQKDLIGGIHLDFLVLTIVVQFGSAWHSTKWFYLLWVVPLWGAWMLYSTFFKNRVPTAAAAAMPDDSSKMGASNEKREKRAQKRSQKWT